MTIILSYPFLSKLKVLFFQLKVNTELLTLSLGLSRYPLFEASFKIGLFFTLLNLVNIICIIGTYLGEKNLKLRFFSPNSSEIINIYFNKGSLSPLFTSTKHVTSFYSQKN